MVMPVPSVVYSPLRPLPSTSLMPSPTLGGGEPILQKIVKTPFCPLLKDTCSFAFPLVAGGGGNLDPGNAVP